MSQPNQKTIQNANDWLSGHGQPSYEVLKSLAELGTPEAMESLRQLAERYNISYVTDTSANELLDKISGAMREESENS